MDSFSLTVAFLEQIGRFYYGIREYEKALNFYNESVKGVGQHHVTFHNQGLCLYSLGRTELALENFKKALLMCPEYEKARSWIEKVQLELGIPPAQSLSPTIALAESIIASNQANSEAENSEPSATGLASVTSNQLPPPPDTTTGTG
jgi:tetratricopeptide (TPR) repeat protein